MEKDTLSGQDESLDRSRRCNSCLSNAAEHSLLYLFADDLFHQILFYFGGVVEWEFCLWEKYTMTSPFSGDGLRRFFFFA